MLLIFFETFPNSTTQVALLTFDMQYKQYPSNGLCDDIFSLVVKSWCKSFSTYRKVASSNTSRLEAHAGFFRLLMKGIFNPYVLRPFDKKLIS